MNAPPDLNLAYLSSKARIAAGLSAIEATPASMSALLDEAYKHPKGIVIGITGPPGAGKSTLINALISEWRGQGKTVAVIAVDPSSRATGGALLGDRVRMRTDPNDSGVFIRSLAARGRLGGLADTAYPSVALLRALYDKVIVESVGVGQSETDIAMVADTVVLCIQPASGDSLQFMKAGIAEIPDIAVVTKADMGAAATRALADLKGALGLSHRDKGAWEPECISVSSTSNDGGLRQLFASFARHEHWLLSENRLAAGREKKAQAWVQAEILAEFGRKGLAVAAQGLFQSWNNRPFGTARRLLAEIAVAWTPGTTA